MAREFDKFDWWNPFDWGGAHDEESIFRGGRTRKEQREYEEAQKRGRGRGRDRDNRDRDRGSDRGRGDDRGGGQYRPTGQDPDKSGFEHIGDIFRREVPGFRQHGFSDSEAQDLSGAGWSPEDASYAYKTLQGNTNLSENKIIYMMEQVGANSFLNDLDGYVEFGNFMDQYDLSSGDFRQIVESGNDIRDVLSTYQQVAENTGETGNDLHDLVMENARDGDITNSIGATQNYRDLSSRDRGRLKDGEPITAAGKQGLEAQQQSQNLLSEFLDYYREDRGEAKEWRNKLDEERKDALDKALEEEKRRRGIEDEARADFLGYREKTRAQYEDEMAQRDQFRDLAQQSYVDRANLMQDIKDAPSTVEESARQSFEQSLANQAALSATLPTRTGGSSAKYLADQARTHNAQIAAQTSVNRMIEQQSKNQMLSGLIGQQEASATQQQNLALGGAQASLAAQSQAMQEMSAQGAIAQRALGAQGLQAGLQTNLGGQYGTNLANTMQAGQGYAGTASGIIGQQHQMQLQREQMDLERMKMWLGLAGGVVGAGTTLAGAAFGGPAGAAVGSQVGSAVGGGMAGQSSFPSGTIA